MIRIGQGFDVHRVKPGNKIILGGIEIESKFSLEGFSDADVLLHALTDAILGALALGDIGDHFPQGKSENKDRNSADFIQFALKLASEKGYEIVNVDCTVIAEKPAIKPVRESIRQNIARLLYVGIDQISIKATTTEQLGFTGRAEGLACMAVILLKKSD